MPFPRNAARHVEPTASSPLLSSCTGCPVEISKPKVDPHKWTVWAIYVSNILHLLTYSAIAPSVLLYLNHRSFTTSSDITAFVVTTVLESVGATIMHVAIAQVAAVRSHAFAAILLAIAAALALVLIVVTPTSLPIFYVAFFTYSSSDALRSVRLSLLTSIVSTERRTSAFSINIFMACVGYILGPLLWLAVQTLQKNYTLSFLGITVYINCFSLNFLICALLFVVKAVIAQLFFRVDQQPGHETRDGDSNMSSIKHEWNPVHVQVEGQATSVVNLKAYRVKVFSSFCAMLIIVSFSRGVYFMSLQPILVNVFRRDEVAMGKVFELIGFVSLLPPLIVSSLSRYMRDRNILAIGLGLMFLGMICFVGTAVSEWRVILGFVLLARVAIFFIHTSISLCSKLLGPLRSPTDIGILLSLCTFGMAAGQMTAGRWVITQFNTPAFALYSLPTAILSVLVFSPRIWDAANDDDPFAKAVRAKAAEQKEAYKKSMGVTMSNAERQHA